MITREEMIELLREHQQLLVRHGRPLIEVIRAENAIAALQAAEPIGYISDLGIKRLQERRSREQFNICNSPSETCSHPVFLHPCPPAKAHVSECGDAYQGAREDLAIWKRRALEAEASVRHKDQIIDRLTSELQGDTRFGEPSLPAKAQVPEGYAGVTVWVGDRQVTQIVNQTELVSSNADELLRRFENARHLLTTSPAPSHSGDELVRDAERYRWLRNRRHSDIEVIGPYGDEDEQFLYEEELDEAIDAQRQQEEAESVIQHRHSCGCVTCICEDDEQCQGCGAATCDDYRGPSCGCTSPTGGAER